eukprot:87424-Alexandrium_andersonii.AAC.1
MSTAQRRTYACNGGKPNKPNPCPPPAGETQEPAQRTGRYCGKTKQLTDRRRPRSNCPDKPTALQDG